MQKYLLLHGTANTIAPPPVLYLSPYPRTAQSGNKYEKNAHGTGLEITPRCPNNGVYIFGGKTFVGDFQQSFYLLVFKFLSKCLF